MNLITRKRFFNIFSLSALLAMPIILFFSFFIQSSLGDIMFFDDFSDIPIAEVDTAKKMMISQILNWNNYHICSNIFTPLFYPIFATLPVVLLSNETHGYMSFEFVRTSRYKSTIISKCLSYSLLSGIIMMCAYWIFILLGLTLQLNPPEYNYGMLMDFFPNLMINHPVLGGIIHGFSVYFPFGFTFGLFASGLALNTQKSYLIVLCPHVYYLLVGNILSTLYNTTGVFLFQQFSPWYPVTITGQSYASWYSTYFSLIPIIIISIFLIVWRCKNENKVFS